MKTTTRIVPIQAYTDDVPVFDKRVFKELPPNDYEFQCYIAELEESPPQDLI